MKNNIIKVLLLILAISVFVVMAIGSGDSDEPASEGTGLPGNSPSQGQNANETLKDNAEYSIGETDVEVWTNSIGTNWIKVSVPVTNTGNVNLYMETSSVDIENEDGSLAATLKLVSVYPQIIKPGETAYYYEETTYDGANTEGLKVVPHVKAEKAKVDLIRFEVSDLQVKDDDWLGASVMGRVENTGNKEETLVYIVANFFDKDGKFIGQQFAILTDKLPSGEKVGFETTSLTSHLKASDIATYDVIAFPFQYQ